MITVTIAGNTSADISKLASELAAALGAKTVAAAAAPAKPAAAAAPAKPAAAAPAKPAPAKPAAKPAPAPAATEGAITLATLRDLGRACIKAGKNEQMKAALTELGSDSITTLDPSKFEELDAKLREVLAEEAAPSTEDASL